MQRNRTGTFNFDGISAAMALVMVCGTPSVGAAAPVATSAAASVPQDYEARQAAVLAAYSADNLNEAEKLARGLIADIAAKSGPDATALWEPTNILAATLNKRGVYHEAELLWRGLVESRLFSGTSPAADTATVLSNLGQNLTIQGNYVEADKFLTKALALVQGAAGEKDPLLGLIYNNLALNKKEAGYLVEAQRYFEKALAVPKALVGERDPQVAEIYDNIGLTLSDRGSPKEAEAMVRQALAIWRETSGENSLAVARGYGNLGLVLKTAGDLPEAEDLTRKSIAIQAAVLGEAAPASYSNLGLILTDQGRFADAEPIARKAVALSETVYGPQHRSTAAAYDNLTIILSSLGRTAESEPYNRKALAIRTAIFGPDSAEAAISYNNLGTTLVDTGRAVEGQQLLEKSIAISRKTLGATHPMLASALRNTGEVYARARRYADAERLHREALAIRLGLFGKDNFETAQSYMSTAAEVNEQGRSVEAEGLGAQAVASAQASKLRSGMAVHNRAAADPASNIYETYLGLAWDAAVQMPADELRFRASGFLVAQELVHSASGDAMAMASARIAAGKGPLAGIVAEQQDLAAVVVDIDKRLLAALAQQDQKIVVDLRQRASVAQARLAALDAEIDRSFPRYRAIISPAPLTLADVQKLLASDEGLLFLVTVNNDVYTFAVTPHATAWHRGRDNADLARAQIRHLRCQVDVEHCQGIPDQSEIAPDGAAHSAHYDLRMANQLYKSLLAPVEPGLAGVTRLYVTASSQLGDLPLGMLVTADPGIDVDDADPAILASAPYLSDRFALTYLPSVAGLSLKTTPAKASRPRRVFVGYGDPTLQGDGTAELDRGGKYYRGVGRSGLPLADPGMIRSAPPLPGTKRELQAMALSLGAPSAAVHLQNAATETAVKADITLSDAKVVAFATHGILPGDIHGFDEPGLILTPPTVASDIDDGVLTASEASQLTLSADWVILSACNTAATEGADGADSLSGLARGFLYAGAHALLASHWAVSDEATAALTVETLTIRRTHPELTKAQAFQRAMRVVRTGRRADGSAVAGYDPGWAHPAAWAPFTHIANHDE